MIDMEDRMLVELSRDFRLPRNSISQMDDAFFGQVYETSHYDDPLKRYQRNRDKFTVILSVVLVLRLKAEGLI